MATLNVKNFPDSLYTSLQQRAALEHRSVAQQVVHLLSKSLESAAPRSILELRGLGKELWQGIDAAEHIERERDSWD
jgi:plasmid stability protein